MFETEVSKLIVAGLMTFLGGGAFVAVINGTFNRRKTEAEAYKTEVDADVTAKDSWKDYALEMQRELKGFKTELNVLYGELRDLKQRYLSLEEEHQKLLIEYEQTRERNVILTTQVDALTQELNKRK